MNYYQHNIGDYRRDTAHLSLLEHGVYRQLMDTYYLTEEVIPNETEVVFRRLCARTEDERLAIQTILSEFFTPTPEGWFHKRCNTDIHAYQAKADRAKENGKLGGRPPKTKEVISGNPDKTTSQANHKPITINQEPETKVNTDAQSAPVAASGDVALVFEFWKTAMKSPRSQLDPKRAKLIKAALKTGYTTEQLCDAITGCAKSPFHMGDNDRRAKFNGLDLILRNAEKIDQFIVIGQSPLVPKRQGFTHDLSQMDYSKGVDEHGNF